MSKRLDLARRGYLGSAALGLCAVLATPLHAADQSSVPTATPSTPAPTPSSAVEATGESAQDTNGVAEIVVTAQHRSENLQRVPLSISAVTAGTLASTGIDATNALPQIVPSVQFTRSGPSGLFFVRGVGQTNAAQGEEGSNAVYVDGVYMADLGQSVNYFNNIQQIEILKGPQGTLFGRNATGGLINIITSDPASELTARGAVTYSNYETLEGQAYVSAPLGQDAGIDLALTRRYQGDGWAKNITTGQDTGLQNYWGARSKAVIKPAAGVKITIAGDYFHNNDSTNLDFDLWPGQVGLGGYGYVPGRNIASDINPATHQTIWGVSGTADIDVGFATLTSITAYRKNHTQSLIDFDTGPISLLQVALDGYTTSFQQELRLVSSSTEPFAWQIGGFYLDAKATNVQTQTGGLFKGLGIGGTFIDDAQVTKSYAVFGDATYAITPTTHLTGGIRYTMDRKRFEGGSQVILASGALTPQTGQPDPHLSYNEITYRAAVRQDITRDINVYASFNRGFKAGLFNLQGPVDPPVKPQFINAFEGGVKSQLFGHKLRLNISAYHYNISNLQVRSGALSSSPGTSFLLNAAKVHVTGAELEFDAAPTSQLHLFGGLNWLHSKFARFDLAPYVIPNPANCATLSQTGPATGGLATCFTSAKGNYTALAPKLTATIGAEYTVPLGGDKELRLNALYAYNSGYYFEPDNVYKQAAFSQVNVSAEFAFTKNWSLQGWCKNLTNKDYFVSALSSVVGTDTTYNPPRTYGVTAKFNY